MIEFLVNVTDCLRRYRIKTILTPFNILANGVSFENKDLCRFETPQKAADYIEHMLKY